VDSKGVDALAMEASCAEGTPVANSSAFDVNCGEPPRLDA